MARPTLRQLDYLLALEHQKSFSKAAIYCNVTQSTLSAGIKELETILEHQLVNRTTRQITLTAFGHDVVSKAKIILNDVDHIVSSAQQIKSPLCGTVRLGIIPTIAPYFLPNILPHIQKSFPDLEIELYEDLSERLIEQLHKRQIDAAIIAFPYQTEELETHELLEENFYLAAPKDKPLPQNSDIQDLDPENLLLLEDGHCLRDHALSACKLSSPIQRKKFSATSLATLIQMVNSGYGVTLLPEMVIKNSTMPSNITIQDLKSPAPMRKIGIIWPKKSPHIRDLNAFLNALRDFLA